jgi:hypothetical protein
MAKEDLAAFLAVLPSNKNLQNATFAADVLPPLIRSLGYRDEHLFFEPSSPPGFGWRWDAIVAPSRTAQAWLAFETKVVHTEILRHQWTQQLRIFVDQLGAEFGVLLTPFLLLVYQRAIGEHHVFDLRRATLDVDRLWDLLKAPAALPAGPKPAPPGKERGPQKCPHFHADRAKLKVAWKAVESAVTAADKGRTLEELAAQLFGGIDYLNVKYRGIPTASSEIDLVLEYQNANHTNVFDEYGRYSLVECKNWSNAVGAKHVRDFVGKLQKTKTHLGFMCTTNGITGANGGEDALREQKWTFDSHRILIVVLAADHYEDVLRGVCFDEIVDNESDRVRFDM